ncbi:MAG TPA: serine O-acetyltransferase [Baekduia sp.]|nr:serine O-acetyltransferase [Baekduia sp.]
MATAPERGTFDVFLDELKSERQRYGFPTQLHERIRHFGNLTLELLFPHYAADVGDVRESDLAVEVEALRDHLCTIVGQAGTSCDAPDSTAQQFIERLPNIRRALDLDAQAMYDGDPAAISTDEIILAYPGFHAIACYRIAHELHDLGAELAARMVTESAHRRTGIDIHPGAQIGPSFAIDHGTGIVVGGTAVIGAHVKLYQGVTLGALSVDKRMASSKRHPTLDDRVVVYANATILGGDTVIGAGSVIGGNVWLPQSVPVNSIVPPTARVDRAKRDAQNEEPLDFNI